MGKQNSFLRLHVNLNYSALDWILGIAINAVIYIFIWIYVFISECFFTICSQSGIKVNRYYSLNILYIYPTVLLKFTNLHLVTSFDNIELYT